MKKNQKMMREFKQLKFQVSQMKEIAASTKVSNLWSHEAAVRKKLKALNTIEPKDSKEFKIVYKEYRELLDRISTRLLDDYNQKNRTAYTLEEVLKGHERAYLSSGILSVLTTSFIPAQMAVLFERYFPDNPKEEYQMARRMKRKFYLHLGETNTGKTYQAIQRLKESQQGIYLAPLRILALEIFETLNEEGIACDLLTGEEEIRKEGARHQSATIEKLDLSKAYEVVVIDEVQLLSDRQRGGAWTRAILGLNCQEIHVCGALNSKELLLTILKDCEDEFEIREYKRSVPLEIKEKAYRFNEVVKGDALIAFSRKKVLELARSYQEQGIKTSMIYGDLPPEVRKMQYHAFASGESTVLVSTDAIGMGINLPIRRILFTSIKKFDGETLRDLTSQEVKQIAGRAGRKNIYEVGYVASIGHQYGFLKEKIEQEDVPLERAVIGPSEALLLIKGLPLREKLALWHQKEEKLSYYTKMEISDYLFVLESIRTYRLKEEIEWKLMKLTFDVHNELVFDYFMDLVHSHFIRKLKEVPKPLEPEHKLEKLEAYYQEVNLYYGFAKSFGVDFDVEWVYKERENISEKINGLLLGV